MRHVLSLLFFSFLRPSEKGVGLCLKDMNESILATIKSICGITFDYNPFDTELIVHINTALMILEQAGIGNNNFKITGSGEVWGDFLNSNKNLEGVKTFVGQKVKVLFDPPSNGTLMTAINDSLSELIWRMNLESDP